MNWIIAILGAGGISYSILEGEGIRRAVSKWEGDPDALSPAWKKAVENLPPFKGTRKAERLAGAGK